MRIGHGYDVHRLTEGRRMILGGVEIPYEKGLLGHSDADVLTHAIMDSLLGAAALGDIGRHFPDSDPLYLGADSLELLRQVCHWLKKKNYHIENIDATILAQRPKLMPYLAQMRNFSGLYKHKGDNRRRAGLYRRVRGNCRSCGLLNCLIWISRIHFTAYTVL